MKKIELFENHSRQPPETDYKTYMFTTRELLLMLAVKLAFTAVAAWLFYDSIVSWLLLIPLSFYSIKEEEKKQCIQRKKRLELEFRDAILSVSSNMQAGYSVENAFNEAYREICLLYGKDSVMAVELRLLLRKINNNVQIEDALMNIAIRSGVQDIMDFADIFGIAKRGGGDMKAIIANTAAIISDKQEVRREIDTVITEKKFENSIMRYMPFLIIFYISLTSKGYFDTMYHNLFGWLVMTAAFVIYKFACRWSDKILDIKV